jgi:hypothetical protein
MAGDMIPIREAAKARMTHHIYSPSMHRQLTAINSCSAATQQMDQNEDMKRLLQQLLLLCAAACSRSADECLPQMYIDS